MKPIVKLKCCCCGSPTKGRQWFNRDNGYSICDSCADAQASREDAEEMKDNYGIRGVHYKLGES